MNATKIAKIEEQVIRMKNLMSDLENKQRVEEERENIVGEVFLTHQLNYLGYHCPAHQSKALLSAEQFGFTVFMFILCLSLLFINFLYLFLFSL